MSHKVTSQAATASLLPEITRPLKNANVAHLNLDWLQLPPQIAPLLPRVQLRDANADKLDHLTVRCLRIAHATTRTFKL